MVYFALVIWWILASVAVSQNATKMLSGKMGLMPGTKAPIHECLKTSSDPQGCAVNQFRNNEGCCLDCPAGSKGTNCSDVCPQGYFGLNCVSKCNCTEDQKCDKIQGCIRTEKDVGSGNTISVSNTPQRILYESDDNDQPDTSSSQSEYQTPTPTHIASQTVETTGLMREEHNMLDVIKPFMIYIVSAIIFLIVVNVFCCVAINRCEFKKGVRRSTAREDKIEDVALQSISDANASDKQETMYANVYTEIIDVEGVYLEPCSGKGGVSRRSSAESKRIPDCGYLDVVAVIEHENSPIDTGIKCPTFGSQRVPDCGYLDVTTIGVKDCSYTETDDDNDIEVKPNDDIQAGNIDTGETMPDCYSAGI